MDHKLRLCPGCNMYMLQLEGVCLSCQEKARNMMGCSPSKPTNPKDRAATNRLDLSLFPDTAVAYGALAMTEGDAKYGGYNFRVDGVLASVYIAACRRHLCRWFNGQDADPQTGVSHLGSALACIAILIDATVCGKLNDDRPPPTDLNKLLADAEQLVGKLHSLYPNGPARFRVIPTQEEKP